MFGDEERTLVRELVVEYAPMGDDFLTVFDYIKEDLTDPETLEMTTLEEGDDRIIKAGRMYYKGVAIVDILDRQKDYAYIVWCNIQKITNIEWGSRPYI